MRAMVRTTLMRSTSRSKKGNLKEGHDRRLVEEVGPRPCIECPRGRPNVGVIGWAEWGNGVLRDGFSVPDTSHRAPFRRMDNLHL
jgi:hypothetical protein